MTSDAQRVAARGLPVRFTDGTEGRIRYDFAALLACEARWGSLQGAGEALARVLNACAGGWQTAALRDLDGIVSDVCGRPLADIDELPNELVLFLRAAWEEAFPSPDPKGAAAD